jgi:peptide/nickel transport system substrate-binding protein
MLTTQPRSVPVLLVALALGASAGCDRSQRSAEPERSTLTIAYGSGAEFLFTGTPRFLVFLPLLELDETGSYRGRLARSWEHSPDGREWTFHLRSDVKWHDGTPVTAQDVAFTLGLVNHPDVAWYEGGPVGTPRVLDDSTLAFHFERRADERDWEWTVIFPRHLLEHLDTKEFGKWEFWQRPVGNGPYRFVRSLPQTLVEFEANPAHYAGKPRIGRVVLRFAGDAAPTELKGGTADAAEMTSTMQIMAFARDRRFRTYPWFNESWTRAILWRTDHPRFQDARVRRALTLAIDRRQLLRMLNLPQTTPMADGLYTPHQRRRGELPPLLRHDPEGAKRLLDEAGWRDRDGDGIREQDGTPFRFTAILPAGHYGAQETGTFVQAQLRGLGVQMELQPLDPGSHLGRVKRGEFEAAFWGISMDPVKIPPDAGASDPLANPAFARLAEEANTAAEPSARDRIYRELSETFRAEMPVTLLFPHPFFTVADQRVGGLSSPYRADPVRYAEHLWLDELLAEAAARR